MCRPAARVTDMHTCPMVTGNVPHVGGPILVPGACTSVIICGVPAATIGTMAQCTGPPDSIAQGSTTVIFEGRLAARQGSSTGHGGVVVGGAPNVFIGGPASAPPPCLAAAQDAAAPGVSAEGGNDGEGFLDGVQTVLDVAGLVPWLGEIADGANTLISLARGDLTGAALSGAAMIPFAGWGATAGKSGRRLDDLSAANRAHHEQYVDGLRRVMQKPSVSDPSLAGFMDELYRPGAQIGSGSTADAVRHELRTGELVGGRSHVQKAQDSITHLERWLERNPTASPGDRAAAENVIIDLRNALGGN